MRTRIITSIVALLVFIPFLVFSGEPSFVFVIAMAILSLASVYEIVKCTGIKNKVLPTALLYFFAIGESIMARYMSTERFFVYTVILTFTVIFISLVCAVFSKGKIGVLDAALSAGMTVYVSYSFAFLIKLRDFSVDGENMGAKIFLLAFLFAWMPDIGGYFAGRFFGKHKLIPDVSPKKTVEGFVGGIVFSVIASVIYSLIIDAEPTGYLIFALLSIVCAIVSVCGDLIASLVKRHYGIKDYGFIFPGHGGVMDRFDSVIATAPVIYIIVYVLYDLNLLSAAIF